MRRNGTGRPVITKIALSLFTVRVKSHAMHSNKSLVTEWLEQASHCHEMCCHDLEGISLNSGQVERGVRSTSVLSCT